MEQHPAIDQAAYAAMKTSMGEIFTAVIDAFLDYLPTQIAGLDTAIQQADCETIFNCAHSIKSSSSSIGALGLASTAEQIEQMGRNGICAGTEQHYQLLQQQFSEAAEFLKAERAA
jgi:HPt (histidine-containing phosphotransfer) domain-containing protein